MGKTAMCIRMLELLNTGRIYKTSELATLLDTNPRNISEYKKELEECGYYLISTPGKYGGYKLEKSNIFPALKLTEEEKIIIKDAYSFLLSHDSFLNKDILNNAMGKIISSFENEAKIEKLKVIEKDKISIQDDYIKDIYNDIKMAIKDSHILSYTYLNTNNKEVERTVEPYKLYIYNNNWFLFGFCRELHDYRYFKLNRMKNLLYTDKKFIKDKYYKESDYFDESGYKKNDEWYDIKFKVYGYPIIKIREEELGKNKKIDYINKNEAIVSVTMQYKLNIISYILSLGLTCEVIEPLWLKQEIIKNSNGILNKYK